MSKFRFDKKARAIQEEKLLNVLSNNAVNFFKITVFNEQGFDGQKWKGRKKDDAGRRLLVKAGHMRQSIRQMGSGRGYRRVGTDVPYAQYHNQGTKYIPKREFIGKSKRLDKINQRTIRDFTKRALASR